MQKPLAEKFVKQSIIKWLFLNGWGRNLEVGELRDQETYPKTLSSWNFPLDKTKLGQPLKGGAALCTILTS